ncbi:MAG: four helix bundle protein [Lentisphaerae bacterium]|nr:four helix bundle protein [Lentisphaerota bacterium]
MNKETTVSADKRYNLEDRLLEYAAMIIRIAERLPATRAGNHIAGQLLRSGTSPLSNHGEAEAAESRQDFIHKLSISLKELRESRRWLRLIHKIMNSSSIPELAAAMTETDELIRIFSTSIKTAEKNEPNK